MAGQHRGDLGPQFVDAGASGKPAYASMLEAVLRSLPQGKSDVPADEMLDTIRIIFIVVGLILKLRR